jgi:hypothetical protein
MSNESHLITRRRFFVIGGGAVALVFGPIGEASASQTASEAFRYCNKCMTLFSEGKGVCPAGGFHEAQGFRFSLPLHGGAETPTSQANWRGCTKCLSMYYAGFKRGGPCPAGGSHGGQDGDFTLPHDVPATKSTQPDWRFCNKCFVMFYNGNPGKGRCAAGGAHFAQGFNFVLPFD